MGWSVALCVNVFFAVFEVWRWPQTLRGSGILLDDAAPASAVDQPLPLRRDTGLVGWAEGRARPVRDFRAFLNLRGVARDRFKVLARKV